MKIISRLTQRLSQDDIVSSQVAAALLGITARTLSPFVEQGKLRAFPAPQAGWTDKKWQVFRVSDLVCFAALNGFAFDKGMLVPPKPAFRHIINNYMMYMVREYKHEAKWGQKVTLKQLIWLLDVFPYTPVMLGDCLGGETTGSITEELRSSFYPFTLNLYYLNVQHRSFLEPLMPKNRWLNSIEEADEYFANFTNVNEQS